MRRFSAVSLLLDVVDMRIMASQPHYGGYTHTNNNQERLTYAADLQYP